MLWILISAAIAALDQVTKYIVFQNIGYGEKIPVINGLFYLTYHENKGAAWGILQNARVYLIVFTIIASAVIIYLIFSNKDRMLRLVLSFILGGAVGNLIDRMLKGSVTDFLDFYIGSYNFPTFNVADSFITIGGILLVFYLLFIYKEA